MNNVMANEYRPESVTHPGETLIETINSLGMSQATLAKRMGKSKKAVNEIIKGVSAITPQTALQLERVLGIPAGFWNNRERNYRESLARKEEQTKLEKQTEWLRIIPYRAMIRLGWIKKFNDKVRQLLEILNFFGVASPQQLQEPWFDRAQVAFRESNVFQSNQAVITAWLRKGELEAQNRACMHYDEEKFKGALRAIRKFTKMLPSEFHSELINLCAGAGVAVVFVRELPDLRISGATRWLSPDKALIQISPRYRVDDQLWFTFFHEAGHILLHGKRDIFIETNGEENKKEKAADKFAADFLIRPDLFEKFLKSAPFEKNEIVKFASELGIDAGILVGRLQHDGVLPFRFHNDLKRKDWLNFLENQL